MLAGQVAVTASGDAELVGPAALFMTIWVWLIRLLVKHTA